MLDMALEVILDDLSRADVGLKPATHICALGPSAREEYGLSSGWMRTRFRAKMRISRENTEATAG